MKIIKKLRIIIIIIVFFIVGVSIWMNWFDFDDTRTYKLIKDKDYSEYKIEITCEYGKTVQQVKANGEISMEMKDDSTEEPDNWIILKNNEGNYDFYRYNILRNDDGKTLEKYAIKKEIYNFEREEMLIYDYYKLMNEGCLKRTYEFLDGELYYVEYIENCNLIGNTVKLYFKGDELKFILDASDSLQTKYYIDNFTTEIDESSFELLEGYTFDEQ